MREEGTEGTDDGTGLVGTVEGQWSEASEGRSLGLWSERSLRFLQSPSGPSVGGVDTVVVTLPQKRTAVAVQVRVTPVVAEEEGVRRAEEVHEVRSTRRGGR